MKCKLISDLIFAKLNETLKELMKKSGKLKIGNIVDRNDAICYGAAIVCEILDAKSKVID